MDDTTTASFAHITGIAVTAAPENEGPTNVTIINAGGANVGTIDGIAPGATCGIEHDFAPGDYLVADNQGNGTQFTSFKEKDRTPPSARSGPSASGGDSGEASLTFNGKTYNFTGGGCSDLLDPNQFLFRSPRTPGNDATYFAIIVTDVTGTSSTGGKYTGAVTYQENGKSIALVSDATLDIADDHS